MDSINNDFYCSASAFLGASDGSTICLYNHNKPCRQDKGCLNYKHKYPTPEQYKEEYGEEYPDNWAVYFLKGEFNSWDGKEPRTATYKFVIETYSYVKNFKKHSPMLAGLVVCACTPFGKPDDTWRPEGA